MNSLLWAPSSERVLKSYVETDYDLSSVQIGSGTYGTVFKARGRKDAREVAVKRIRVEKNFDRDSLELYSELKALGIRSPYLVEVYAMQPSRPVAGQDHGYVCVVMEVMESGLDRLFRHRLTREEYTHVALSILRGLQALHARNLVHGDLHKNNVLYNRYGMVKLADYGKVTAPAGVRSAGPQVPPGEGGAGQLIELMVPSYMRPPELLLGSKEITPAIDVWCFGILLVQLAAGESTLLRSGQISYADEGSPHPERRYRYFLQILRSYADLTGHPAVPHGLRSLPRCQSIPHVLGVDTISRALVDLPNGLHSSLRSDRISALKDRLGPHWWPLVKSCLHPDPSQRPRVADLVSHPFFDGAVWVSLPLA